MSTHHVIFLAVLLVLLTFATFIGFIWGKGKNGAFDGTPLGIWVGGCCSAFIGGFAEGTPIGTTAGAGFAMADGQAHADFKPMHLAIEAAHLLAIPVGTGLADVRNWIKSNPFPNVFERDLPATKAP